MTESFEDAIKALRHIARGNGSVLRIADRIVAAHERELAAAKLAAEMPTYDVEGNERHKAACELRDMKIGKLSTHWNFVCSLAARLNIPRPNDEPYEDYELHELIRDKLVNLLEGECNFSTPESYMACEDGDQNPAEMSPDEQTSVTLGTCSPITGELRAAMSKCSDNHALVIIRLDAFDRCCDAIDSVHAQLERENGDLRMKFVNANRHAQHVERENESLKAELDCVLGEQENRDGWVELPKDEDGVPIHVGDMLAGQKVGGGYCEPFKVVRIDFNGYDWIVYASAHAGHIPDKCRHYQPDTWERIIEDAIDAVDDVWADDRHDALVASLVARCKKLAGDAE